MRGRLSMRYTTNSVNRAKHFQCIELLDFCVDPQKETAQEMAVTSSLRS